MHILGVQLHVFARYKVSMVKAVTGRAVHRCQWRQRQHHTTDRAWLQRLITKWAKKITWCYISAKCLLTFWKKHNESMSLSAKSRAPGPRCKTGTSKYGENFGMPTWRLHLLPITPRLGEFPARKLKLNHCTMCTAFDIAFQWLSWHQNADNLDL